MKGGSMGRTVSELQRLRMTREVDTEELQAVLSRTTIWKIERGEPVSYKSAVLYCRALGLDPDEYIPSKIPILEEIAS